MGVQLHTIPYIDDIESYRAKTNQWQYQYAGTPKQALNAKVESIPPTLLAPVSVHVQGAGCCCGAWYN